MGKGALLLYIVSPRLLIVCKEGSDLVQTSKSERRALRGEEDHHTESSLTGYRAVLRDAVEVPSDTTTRSTSAGGPLPLSRSYFSLHLTTSCPLSLPLSLCLS